LFLTQGFRLVLPVGLAEDFMAETTRPTSGTPTQPTSTAASPGTSTGGARNASTPSSNPSGSPAAARPGSNTSTTNQGQRPSAQAQGQQQQQSQGQQSQGQQSQGQQAQNPQTQTQQRPSQQAEGSQTQGQQTQGQQTQGQRQGEHRDGEHHVELTGNAISDAKKVGSELVSAARDSATSLLDAQRARAADQIVAIGEALRRSAESFESTGAAALTQYVDQAADQLCGFADTVRDRSWNDLAGDVESFARRYPTMFMLSALGVGFIAGRFLLSSERARTAGGSGASYSGGYGSDTRRDIGGTSRTVSSGARAEYGSSIRE
jgi:hypothetical protein